MLLIISWFVKTRWNSNIFAGGLVLLPFYPENWIHLYLFVYFYLFIFLALAGMRIQFGVDFCYSRQGFMND